MRHSEEKNKTDKSLFAQFPRIFAGRIRIYFQQYMKKFILDLTVTENLRLHTNYVLLKLTSQTVLPGYATGTVCWKFG